MENNSHKEVTSLKDFFQIIKDNRVTFFIFALLVIIAYGNLVRGDFINMDDEKGILYNPDVKNVGKMLGSLMLYNIQISLTHAIFGFNAGAYHAVSIFIHFINVVLTFLVVYAVFDKKTALISSLLFSVHPLASEAVGWISAAHYLHIAFFTLLGMLFHYLYKTTEIKKYYIIELLIFMVAVTVLRNAWVLTIPFSMLVFDQFIICKKINLRSALLILPYFLMAGVHAYINIFGDFSNRVTALTLDYYYNPYTATPLLNRTPYIIFTVLKLLLMPIPLTVYHEGVYISTVSYVAMIAITIALFIFCIKIYKKSAYIVGLFALIFISTLPSFSPVAIAWFIAERYLYLSTLAFSILLAITVRYLEKYTGIKKLALFTITILVSLYTLRTALRTQDLLNTSNLWHATQKVSPYSFRVYNNLGDVYAKIGDYDTAIEMFQTSLKLDPSYADAVHNLGYVYLQKGDTQNAKKYLLQSYEMNPRLYGATYKLGVAAFMEKDYETARAYWLKTLELSPGDASAVNALRELDRILSETEQ